MKYINQILLFISVAFLLVSCDLTRKPSYAMDKDSALETLDDAEKWATQQVTSFRGRLMGPYDRLQDIQSDMLNASVDFGNRLGDFYNWNGLQAGTYELRDVYHAYYLSLKNVNYFLTHVQNIEAKGEDKARIDYLVGQAQFFRAYYYFNLAMRYGTVYNKATADKDLCVPLVLEESHTAKPARATNKEVYGQIDKDLKEAITRLASNAGEAGATDLTQDAAKALQARVALYKGDFEQAYSSAKELIDSKKYPLGKSAEDLMKMWRADSSKEDIFRLFISRPDELPNRNIYYSPITGHKEDNKPVKVFGPDWIPPQWVLDLYDDNDYRKPIYFEAVDLLASEAIYKDISIIAKFKGNPEFITINDDPAFGRVPNSYISPKVFRIAEMYLIAAEAGQKTGKADALKFLNALKKSRGLSEVNLSGDALMKEIQDERTRELAYEGFRLFDLRRWNMPVNRHSPQTLPDKTYPFLSLNPSPEDFKIDTNNKKWIWGLPAYELQTNPNLVQNPGW